jgi:hypothetical protein
MRRVFTFVASFAVVLLAGVAVAKIGGLPSSYDPAAVLAEPAEKIATVAEATEPVTKDDPEPVIKDDVDDVVEKDDPGPVNEGEWVVEEAAETEAPDKTVTTAVPVDDDPPDIVILHPENGAHFDQKEVVFEGITEVGARVFAGDYEATVDEEGGWRIVLFLNPGGNVATLVAVDAAGNQGKDSVEVFLDIPKQETGETDFEFSAHNVYGECDSNPPYDVYWGTGEPGDTIAIISEYGGASTIVNEHGEWEVRVEFPEAPVGKVILVTVKDSAGHKRQFEFVRIG